MTSAAQSEARDTIYALASGHGRAGIAVVRISGPLADHVIETLTRRRLPTERSAEFRTMFSITNGDIIDAGIVLRFGATKSYTGEGVAEFHVHGGPAIITALLKELATLPGLRLAEPGEFTRRAVESGRLDLTQAEAIADLVAAETDAQRRQALSQLGGRLKDLYERWRTELIRAAAWIEATIDFPDEEIPKDAAAGSRATIAGLAAEMRAHLDDGRRGEIMRDGFQVAIIGPPNAGKSSLINALAKRDVAIVSDIPGTTRDVLEVRLDLKGYPVILADTAGLRAAKDQIEEEGVRRARARAESADLRLLVLDGSDQSSGTDARAELTVRNKADLVAERPGPDLWISAKTGEGLTDLIGILAERAQAHMATGEAPVLTRERHREAIDQARKNLEDALAANASEIAAEHLRLALRNVGRLTGRVDLDELLDVVFRDFCIGK